MNDRPLVTVLIPARNEVRDIASCIDHVAAQHYPLDRIEVVVVDGASTDGTVSAAEEALAGHAFHHAAVLTNREGTTPSNLNVGLRYATGEIVCRVDARTRIEPQYVRTCVDVLTNRPDLSVVGGSQRAIARDGSTRALGIARALNNRYSMGGSPYRRALTSGPSDTVYLGAFRRADLLEVHGWDERLGTNQDFDLNRRMAARGVVWFDASLRSGYVPRATYRDLWNQYVRFGQAKVAYWELSGDRPQPRQRALLALPALAAASLGAAALRRRLGAAVLLGLLGLLGVERVGSDHRRTRIGAHLAGAGAMVCVGLGWTFGAWWAWLRRRARG
jgi:glycosyltransferase involved in cell wall biosynthesis